MVDNWEYAHDKEIVWHETLKENECILDIFEIYFITIENQNIGKASTIFYQTAAELKNIALRNKLLFL